MRFPWKPRHHRDSDVVSTSKVSLGEVDDRSRPYTTSIERPGQYTPIDHNRATFGVDRETGLLMVAENVAQALANQAVDEYTSDFMDARIGTARVGWDTATDQEAASRLHTTTQLMAVQLEDLTRVYITLQPQRQAVADLEATVRGWQAVLRGESIYAPIEASRVENINGSAPELQPIPISSIIASLRPARPYPAGDTPTNPATQPTLQNPGTDTDPDHADTSSTLSYMFDKEQTK
jgi:hypothetical protein